jgi:hypothetical protein
VCEKFQKNIGKDYIPKTQNQKSSKMENVTELLNLSKFLPNNF